jgi:hypothetical protein
MRDRHSATAAEASKRARRIALYVRTATDYVDQALSTDRDVAFLPAYYAILNFLKVYILLSREHSRLEANRWHGATYDVYGKDSHGLPTELVTLRSGGAIPLFYEVITGQKFADKTRIRPGETVAVCGGGPIGQLAAQVMSRYGATSLTVIEPIAARRETALRNGADHAIDPLRENQQERTREITGGRGFDVVIDASGSPSAVRGLLDIAAPGATVVYGAK